MKRAFGKWGCILALFVGIFIISLNPKKVYAEEPQYLGNIVDESVLTNDDEAEHTHYTRLRYSNEMQGFIKNTYNRNGIVAIGASTDCFVTSDVVKLNIYLERSKGDSNFSSYKSFEYTAYNTYTLTKGFNYVVPKGYYYRLRGYHYASKNGIGENLGSRTNGIYIG